MSENDYKPNTGQDAAGTAPTSNDDEADSARDPAEAAAGRDAAGSAPDAPQAEITALNERVLRLAAELENTRRRAEREKADAGRYAIASFARDLLDVADNFDRALRAADGASGEDAIAGLLDGVRMTEKELLTALERHGVRRIHPEGEKFDPNLHQAVAHVPSAAVPSGHVVDVAQPGFTIGERVLRAAMVTVSAGGGAQNGGPQNSGPEKSGGADDGVGDGAAEKGAADNARSERAGAAPRGESGGLGGEGVSGANLDTQV